MITAEAIIRARHGDDAEMYRIVVEVAGNLFWYLAKGQIPVETCGIFAEAFLEMADVEAPTDLPTIMATLQAVIDHRAH